MMQQQIQVSPAPLVVPEKRWIVHPNTGKLWSPPQPTSFVYNPSAAASLLRTHTFVDRDGEFERHWNKMSLNIFNSPSRRKGRTFEQVKNSCHAVVLEFALCDLIPEFSLGTFGDNAYDVIHLDGTKIDVKRQKVGYLEFVPENWRHLYEHIDQVDLVLTGDYKRVSEDTWEIEYKQCLKASTIFNCRRLWEEDFTPVPGEMWRVMSRLSKSSIYEKKHANGVFFYDHRDNDRTVYVTDMVGRDYDKKDVEEYDPEDFVDNQL